MKIETVKQRDLKDCGACCLYCILKYYNGYVPLEKIRDDTLTTINGTTAYHLIEAAKSYGFDAVGVRVDNIDDERIYLPAIAHLTLKNGLTHFVIIYKITSDYVWLMDPARGKVKMPRNEFLYLWSNVLIELTPTTNVLCLKKELSLHQLFLRLLARNKSLFISILLTNFLLMLFSIIGNFYFEVSISSLNNNKDSILIKVIVIVFLFIFLFKIVFSFLKNYYLNFFNKNLDAELFTDFIKHIFNLPLKFLQNRTTGEIVSRINELGEVKSLLSEVFTTIILSTVLAFGAIVALYFISTKLFFLLCLVISIYIIIGTIFSKTIYYHAKENIAIATDFNATLIENIEMNPSIKNLKLEDSFLRKLENKLISLLRSNFNLDTLLNNTNFFKEFIYEFGLFLILTYGIYLIKIGKLETLSFITFNSLIIYLFNPIKDMLELVPKYNYLKASFTKLSELLNIKEEDYFLGLDSTINSITIENLSYSYNKVTNILNNLSLDIKARDKILLTGASGSGKSTLCHLLLDKSLSYSGKISFNNVNQADLSLETIRNNILYIGQQEKLFTGSIKDNIICNRPVSSEELMQVLQICRLKDFIDTRPNRLETIINANLNNLSGGEKQRLILARGLLKNCNVIILDEALSEVDLKLEKQIIGDIMKFYKDKILIYVSHKDVRDKFKKVISIGAK